MGAYDDDSDDLSMCYMYVQRLLIAKEYGDRSAERRAYSNLGNAQIFLGNFTAAAELYQ